jgi:ParB family transcriptional regulator, chromosome partitioning protein
MPKPALGRGLGALMGGVSGALKSTPGPIPRVSPGPDAEPVSDSIEQVAFVALKRIHPSTLQPRKDFPAGALQELADSIREQGVLQPLILRPRGEEFELIAGERRWRAAQIVGLQEVPALVREADDRKVLEMMLIENLQRENLNGIEEALGYRELIEHFQLTQEEVAQRVGKSRASVANALRLLKLRPEIQTHVREGRLSVGHAKVVLGLAVEEEQLLAIERVLREDLNVRQTESLVAHLQKKRLQGFDDGKPTSVNRVWTRDVHVTELETRLKQRLATKVSLRYRQGKGGIDIHFFSDDDLQRILEIIGVKLD